MPASYPTFCQRCTTSKHTLLTGYCMSVRCDGCGRVCDCAMVQGEINSKTGTQNRPYVPGVVLLVRATLTVGDVPHVWDFDWNDREAVRRFAADSDRCIRAGGKTSLEPVS